MVLTSIKLIVSVSFDSPLIVKMYNRYSVNYTDSAFAKMRPTIRAVDRWVRAAFSGIFLGFELFRSDGDSRPTYY